MTTYKPTNKKCPHCHDTFEFLEIMSHNTFSTTYWTDGRGYDALRGFNGMCKCPACSSFFWRKDAIAVKKEPYSDESFIKQRLAFINKMVHPKNQDETNSEDTYPAIQDITLPQMFDFLVSPALTSTEEEYYVRKMIWWSYNDYYRALYPHEEHYTQQEEGSPLVVLQEKNSENMKALLDLVELTSDEEILTKAELYRQLGQFDECLSLLTTCSDKYEVAKSIIYEQATNKNNYVQLLK